MLSLSLKWYMTCTSIIVLTVVSGTQAQANGDLRLNDDNSQSFSNSTGGRLEIYLNSEWGTICDDNFGFVEATVACRQLGFYEPLYFGSAGRLGFRNGGKDDLIHLDQVNCTGTENVLHLLSCNRNILRDHDCLHTEDVAIICNSTRFSEINPFDGQLRLEKGEYSSEGRVEVYCNAEWGTICDDSFSQVEADTICTQLGYTSASDFNHLIELRVESSQSIWLDNVDCKEKKSCISSCQRCPDKEQHDCNHSEDVTVQCTYDTLFENEFVEVQSCKFETSKSLSGDVIALIVVGSIFVLMCCSIFCVIIALVICWKGRKKYNSEEATSDITDTTKSSTQPIPPPRPTDLPPLPTPTSLFSHVFSPFSPGECNIATQPVPPPRPSNFSQLTTPTSMSALKFPPLSNQDLVPVYVQPPGASERPIYIEPNKTFEEEPPPPYPEYNLYELTPTGSQNNVSSQITHNKESEKDDEILSGVHIYNNTLGNPQYENTLAVPHQTDYSNM